MARHTYKVCQVLPRDPEQKLGRPPREVLMAWENLSAQEVIQIRTFQEPRLRSDQIAELDGKIVARGLEPVAEPRLAPEAEETVEGDDVDEADMADETHEEASEAADVDHAPKAGDPVTVTRHATLMLWDAYRRHAVASAELRAQTNELNRRAIAQAKQLDETLSAMHNRQSSAPISVNMEDLMDILRIGKSMVRDFRNGGSEPDPEQDE